jgi:lipid-binding SYLF domain-containing protein
MLSFASGSALAQDEKAKKQAEVRAATQESLEKFYKADPSLQAAVQNAPGYAVFKTYGISFLIGGGGGTGLAHDNKTKKDTFMSMAQGSAGVQAGLAESETLFIFKSHKVMEGFINKGWSGGGGGAMQAGAGGKSVGAAGGGTPGLSFYTLTRNGLQAGVAMEGTKFWKDKDLN